MYPEARQCRITGDEMFGAVAVQSPEVPDLWGVFHPVMSGMWVDAAAVQNWTPLDAIPATPPADSDGTSVEEPPE